jgi:asparagine synthase (glutamine-hydrolysing)
MCGIIGEFSNTPNLNIITQLAQLMAKRGPDDEGYWTDSQKCAVGFRRLAILDLSPAGHQPMITADGRYVIVFNGEIYNFQSLRDRLRHEGIVFKSVGDTEVLLYALALWGVDALSELNGMFALAFYDSHEQTLLLARDHAGIKPLYYMHTEKGLVFASQYDQIIMHPFAKTRNTDLQALAAYFEFGYMPAPQALLHDTFMLEPGTWLKIDKDFHVRTGRFFDFPLYREPDLFGEAAIEATEAAIDAAVKRQLISDVPIGVFISGGIDSPLVAAKIAQYASGDFKAFTIKSDDPSADESQDAAKYAQALGLNLIVEEIDSTYLLNNLDPILASLSEPLADYSLIPTYLVSKVARQHVTVSLSGDGGDELFWGYPSRFGRILENAHHFRHPQWRRFAHYSSQRVMGRTAVFDTRYANIGDRYRAAHTYVSMHWLRKIMPEVAHYHSVLPIFNYDGYEIDQTAQWMRWNEYNGHLTRILMKVDRASMSQSLEVRVPLLDREVIDVASRIDWRTCLDLKSKTGKLPLRAALSRHIPFQTQAKRGFTVPIIDWLKGPLKPLYHDLLTSRDQLLGIPVNRDQFQKLFKTFENGQHGYAPALWAFFVLLHWEQHVYNRR